MSPMFEIDNLGILNIDTNRGYLTIDRDEGNLSFYGTPSELPLVGPRGLIATVTTSTSVVLTWDDWIGPETLDYYNVYRSTSPDVDIVLGNRIVSAVSTSEYTDSGLSTGTTYYYRVTAVTMEGNETPGSNEDSTMPEVVVLVNNYSLSFSGSKDRVNCRGDASLQPQSSITLEFWAYHRNASRSLDGGIAFGWIFGGPGFYSYKFDFSNGTPRCSISNGSTTYSINAGIIDALTWTHWAMTWDGSILTLLKNGSVVDTLAASITLDYNIIDHYFMIGARPDGYYSLDGFLDEVRLWDYARTHTEIANNMTSEIPAGKDGLISKWRFEEGSSTVALDSVGSNNGSITGATYSTETPF